MASNPWKHKIIKICFSSSTVDGTPQRGTTLSADFGGCPPCACFCSQGLRRRLRRPSFELRCDTTHPTCTACNSSKLSTDYVAQRKTPAISHKTPSWDRKSLSPLPCGRQCLHSLATLSLHQHTRTHSPLRPLSSGMRRPDPKISQERMLLVLDPWSLP